MNTARMQLARTILKIPRERLAQADPSDGAALELTVACAAESYLAGDLYLQACQARGRETLASERFTRWSAVCGALRRVIETDATSGEGA